VTIIENLRSSRIEFLFYHKGVAVFMYPSMSAPSPTLYLHVGCDHLDWQVSSMAQIFDDLSPVFSTMVDLTLDYRSHTLSSEWHNQTDRTQWHKLLGSFRNVQTLHVRGGLVGGLSHCLSLDGEPPSGILPKLKTLVCPMGSCDDKTFAAFVHDHEVAALPIKLIEYPFPAGDAVAMYKFKTPTGVDYII